MTVAQHLSKTNEHYTPASVVEAARSLLGGFDVDPASCGDANVSVCATRIHTQDDDGLAHEWRGRVFLNPPGGLLKQDPSTGAWRPGKGGGCRSSAHVWWTKLVAEWLAGRVIEAIYVGFTLEVLRVHQAPAWRGAPVFPVQLFHRCYPAHRLEFGGTSPTHANVIAFLPRDVGRFAAFADAFGSLGFCEPGRGKLDAASAV